MKKIISFITLVAFCFTLTSCSLFFVKPITPDIKAPDVKEPAVKVPDVKIPVDSNFTNADTPEQAITDISVDLLKGLYTGNENILISPVSISLALGLTTGGTCSNTYDQLERFLGRGIDMEKMNSFYTAITEKMEESEKVDIELANSIWIRNSKDAIDVKKSFIDFADEVFDADVYREAFDDNTVSKINGWVNDNTDGMIKKIIDDIDAETLMYLINALSFDAKWQREYTEVDKYFKFTNYLGDKNTVTAMESTEARYISDADTTGFVKNYDGGEYAFAVLLPNEDITINDYISELSGEKFTSLLENVQTVSVETKLPKFTFEYMSSIKDTLRSLGVTDAFDESIADLSGIGTSPIGNLYVSEVLHKTFIEVAEKGTRAAAVTSVEVNAESAYIPQENKKVIVNRPFVFAIIDNSTNMPLFLGAVLDLE